MPLVVVALLIGMVAGLRSMLPLAAVSWAARLGLLPLGGSHLAFLGYAITPYLFTALSMLELVVDKLPTTPSRKRPAGFITRLITGGFSAAAIGSALGAPWVGLCCGVVGALIGTFGGAAVRAKLAAAFGKDIPAALLEDVTAIVCSFLIVTHV
jgi:uncharacterized membrane protein